MTINNTSYIEHYSDWDRRAPITPWGKAQTVRKICEGFKQVSTAGHGGVQAGGKIARKIPEVFKIGASNGRGWYEEDCAMLVPLYFSYDEIKEQVLSSGNHEEHYMAPQWWNDFTKEYCEKQIKSWYQAEWEIYSGETLPIPEHRMTTRERIEEAKAELLRKLRSKTVKIKKGNTIIFQHPICFTSGIERAEFIYDSRNYFFTTDGYKVKMTGWRNRQFTINKTTN